MPIFSAFLAQNALKEVQYADKNANLFRYNTHRPNCTAQKTGELLLFIKFVVCYTRSNIFNHLIYVTLHTN